MGTFLRRLCHRTDGGAAVEFGFVFPLFLILLMGIAEYGLAMFQMMNVSNAAQVGAQYAMLNGYDPNNPNAIANAVNAASGIPAGSVSVTEVFGCANGASIGACGSGVTPGGYVKVTVSQPYSPVAPGIPSPMTIATWVRVQ
jgi:Flp pilus assembly protein TadG